MIDLLKTITDPNEKDYNKVFNEVATELLNNYAIKTPEGLFRMLELEFYWNSKNHDDKTVYDRRHTDPKTGEWFHHYTGVDIALQNQENYGGILIRKIKHIETGKVYNGPMVCAMKLFSGHPAFESQEAIPPTIIISYNHSEQKNPGLKPRINIGKNGEPGGFKTKPYNFSIAPK